MPLYSKFLKTITSSETDDLTSITPALFIVAESCCTDGFMLYSSESGLTPSILTVPANGMIVCTLPSG